MPDYPQSNMLANALSPYLRQHADNPVHWREWGAAALEEATARNRPILLSVGYAACHWCHVMAHESFEDDQIATLMNDLFVNIKVDREERPDVDQIYMAALHALGEQGGWPLTMFLTPAGEPFWGGTYFPKQPRYGRPGFADVLAAVADAFRNEPDKVCGNAAAITRHLKRSMSSGADDQQPSGGPRSLPDRAALDRVCLQILNATDAVNGGIGRAPKFPNASLFETLWRGYLRSGDHSMRQAAIRWTHALCQGGIYDHLGGGLARYAVDDRWLVPHFEKMLYDNAQFIRSLNWIGAATGEALYRQRLEETVAFLLDSLRLDGGAFAASLDADSEGEEGRYYVWTKAEIDALLDDEAGLFNAIYDVTDGGNWEGRTIISRLTSDGRSLSAEETAALGRAKARLLSARRQRVPPARDDKVLADWNGLAIRALAEAGQSLGRTAWIEAAEAAFSFIDTQMNQSGRLGHAHRNGRTTFPGLATDYASMINAAIALYAATGRRDRLESAQGWCAMLDQWHADGHGGYVLSAADQNDVLLRSRSDFDEAVPSATAMIVEAQLRLGLATSDPVLIERAHHTAIDGWRRVAAQPLGAGALLNALDSLIDPKKLVIVDPTGPLLAAAARHPDPARLDIVADSQTQMHALLPTDGLSQTSPAGARAAKHTNGIAILCRGPVCLPPVHDGEALAALLAPGALL